MNWNDEQWHRWTNAQIKRYMKNVTRNFVVCGMVMTTELAESAAKAFGYRTDEDIPQQFHDLAYEVAIEYESGDEAQNEFGANL